MPIYLVYYTRISLYLYIYPIRAFVFLTMNRSRDTCIIVKKVAAILRLKEFFFVVVVTPFYNCEVSHISFAFVCEIMSDSCDKIVKLCRCLKLEFDVKSELIVYFTNIFTCYAYT